MPCYVPVCGRCPGICTNRTHKLFFPPAYTELAECSMMTTSISGPKLHVRRRRSPATQPTCLKRQQMELNCGLQYQVTSQEWPKQHMRRPPCVLHSHSTSQLRFLFQIAFLLCCVSGRFFSYKLEQFGAKGIFKMFRGEEAIFSYRKFVYILGIPENCIFRIEYFVALLQPNS